MSEEMHEEPVTFGGVSPFGLAKRVKDSVRCSCQGHCTEEDAIYLWLYVDRNKLPLTEGESKPSLHHWLNAIDEAAAAGVRYLVVSLDSGLRAFPHLWEICDWAQSTHEMVVGLHTCCPELPEEHLANVRQLNSELTRLLLNQDTLSRHAHLEQEGLRLRPGALEHHEMPHVCDKPGRLLFVDCRGVIYTCGMVEGDDRYRLGTIFEHRFREILRNPGLPHAVPNEDQHKGHGCEGCPPLLASHLV